MSLSTSTLVGTHQLRVVEAARRWARARGGVRAGETDADRALREEVEMLEHVQREARAEDDTVPTRVQR